MMRRYKGDAIAEAKRRVDEATKADDDEGIILWIMVIEAIDEISRSPDGRVRRCTDRD
jgi:hypothetical protein